MKTALSLFTLLIYKIYIFKFNKPILLLWWDIRRQSLEWRRTRIVFHPEGAIRDQPSRRFTVVSVIEMDGAVREYRECDAGMLYERSSDTCIWYSPRSSLSILIWYNAKLFCQVYKYIRLCFTICTFFDDRNCEENAFLRLHENCKYYSYGSKNSGQPL